MSITVFANGNGLFHKGSGGTGMATPDVCLSPPPPPAGPVPVPYPNNLQASNLAKGSKKVKIQGQPTALQDTSYVSTSTGDEGGTQGGNVLTHKTKGKGYFTLWSFDVKIEGKNVDRHDDPMMQNCASPPPGGLDIKARVASYVAEYVTPVAKPCARNYRSRGRNNDRHGSPTATQTAHVNQGNPPICWECARPCVGARGPAIADHQPPLNVAWYAGGCHLPREMWRDMIRSNRMVKPHCRSCSPRQGGLLGNYSRRSLIPNHTANRAQGLVQRLTGLFR